jgi:hypothetical protein
MSTAPLELTDDQCNYITWHLCASEVIPQTMYDTNIPEQSFVRLYTTAQRKFRIKPFEKKYKRFLEGDKEFQYPIADDDKFVVFKTKLLTNTYTHPWLECQWKREMLTPIQFPWSKDMDDITYVNRTTLKLNNRMFINFETHYDDKEDTSPIHMIYVNYNHSSQAESNGVLPTLQSIKSLLLL